MPEFELLNDPEAVCLLCSNCQAVVCVHFRGGAMDACAHCVEDLADWLTQAGLHGEHPTETTLH
jgi:hypothetical protein